MNDVFPPTTTASVTSAPFAGFWIRGLALLMDLFILAAPIHFIDAAFPGTTDAAGRTHSNTVADLLSLALSIFYNVFFTSSKWQATPGKRAMGIYIIRSNGEAISRARAVGRYFASILSGILLCAGYIMAGVTREKTALHDRICDTRVVYGKR